ncbi:anthranilate phosphoribosyltransferase [Phaeodactylibacter luteus]|uniref:Anthranilate phosphoribosyltransferase n=1 Tax=Phaeodactylibacter luteus TaxID=1564516 RepID=A0A5C6S4K9_9BACT|nr:anthranilate phosphoribosyltransferase [Phaeodactylibacter luteus]TXB69560.1 anthranilate phosphoribosyltransferase [Phaeodactylibacter luteus]
MKAILERLFLHNRLSRSEAREVMLGIGEGSYNPAEMATLAAVYRMRPISIPELQGFRDALLELAVPFPLEGMEAIDIVGTGGDGKNTFNISTLSAIVVAGAGYKVAKHGSYGVSSAVGSSNVLQELGYVFTSDTDVLRRQLDRANICFLHAPLFHPALKEVAPVRKQLGVKTFFNMLGPLVNPAQPSHQLYGTYSLELSRLYQYIMQESGRQFAIVYALDGYDEVSLTGPFRFRTNAKDTLLSPGDLSMPTLKPEDLHGGDTPEEAAAIFRGVLENRGAAAHEMAVVANAGLAIQTLCPGKSWADCAAEARESIQSGKAMAKLKTLLN